MYTRVSPINQYIRSSLLVLERHRQSAAGGFRATSNGYRGSDIGLLNRSSFLLCSMGRALPVRGSIPATRMGTAANLHVHDTA